MTIELQPFGTPNFVIQKMAPRPKQEGMIECPKYHLRELDADTLAELCDQFRREIFEKAGMPDPRTNTTTRRRRIGRTTKLCNRGSKNKP